MPFVLNRLCRRFLASYPRLTDGQSAVCENAYRRCLLLLLMRLAVPELLPIPRWALTPPFHPYPQRKRRAVCFLLRCLYLPKCTGVASCTHRQTPGVTRHHALWSPDFPPGTRPSGKPVHRRVYSINFCIFAPETLPCSPPARCNVRGFQKKRPPHFRFQQVLIPAIYV